MQIQKRGGLINGPRSQKKLGRMESRTQMEGLPSNRSSSTFFFKRKEGRKESCGILRKEERKVVEY